MAKKIIFFELNEVPFRVLDDFCKTHPQSTLAQTMSQMHQRTTLAEDIGHLSPWVTWPSLQRGVNNKQHGLAEIGQTTEAATTTYPPIWKLLCDSGVQTGVFGSLGTYPLPPDAQKYSFYVPDTFAESPETYPSHIESFQNFNLALVKRSGRNVYSGLPIKIAFRLLSSFAKLGIRLQTLFSAGLQILHEQINPKIKIRRRTFQSILAYDIFKKLLSTTQPDFCTFFTNHVASSMHRYWAARYPDDYKKNEFDSTWIKKYSGEIDYSMSVFDRFFTDLKIFCDHHTDYQIWIASSMGQGPSRSTPIKTELALKDVSLFLQSMGIKALKVVPLNAMFPQVNFALDPNAAKLFREKMCEISINERPLGFTEFQPNCFSLDLGHPNLLPNQKIKFGNQEYPLGDFGFNLQENEDGSTSSAYHIPEGIFLRYDPLNTNPEPSLQRQTISALEIAPIILRFFGIKPKSYMRTINPRAS